MGANRYAGGPLFDRVCQEHDLEHRLTQSNHPWTNGQLERINRTLKEATVSRDYYQTHRPLREHLYQFLRADQFAKRLKALARLTPYEHILKCWQKDPKSFTIDPTHHTLGLNK